MLVHIVYVPDADLRGPDLDRINRVEDVPDEVSRLMLGDGSARVPTDDELAAYQKALKDSEPDAPAADSPTDSADPVQAKRSPAQRSKAAPEPAEAQTTAAL